MFRHNEFLDQKGCLSLSDITTHPLHATFTKPVHSHHSFQAMGRPNVTVGIEENPYYNHRDIDGSPSASLALDVTLAWGSVVSSCRAAWVAGMPLCALPDHSGS
ncbi:hypothetical protein UPYG_G00215950 [Umbra pygmaea]|uniref:Uncharacterized protein n=1 Tax=Umbra pygmaea TaxID=75934 RepID=A0ABD0X6X7_UMBPY